MLVLIIISRVYFCCINGIPHGRFEELMQILRLNCKQKELRVSVEFQEKADHRATGGRIWKDGHMAQMMFLIVIVLQHVFLNPIDSWRCTLH